MMELTRQTAWAAATDSANRNMRANGRTAWNEDDYNFAADTFNAIWGNK